jgi:hypothetical protein
MCIASNGQTSTQYPQNRQRPMSIDGLFFFSATWTISMQMLGQAREHEPHPVHFASSSL